MDLENMRRNWDQMNQRLNTLEDEVDKMKNISLKETSQQRLVKQYNVLAVVGLVFGLTSWLTLKEVFQNIVFLIAFSLFFLVASAMDFYLKYKVEAINVFEMTVREVAELAHQCRRKHHLFQLILIPFAIVLIGWMALTTDNEVFRIGIIGGLIVGLIVGLKIYLGMMRNYKVLMKGANIFILLILFSAFSFLPYGIFC